MSEGVDLTLLPDVLGGLVAATAQALECTPLGRPSNLYIAHNRIFDDCCDGVYAYLETAQATTETNWPNQFGDNEPFCYDACFAPTIRLAVRRRCYPVFSGNAASPFPRPDRVTVAGEDLLADYQVLACVIPHRLQSIVNNRQGARHYGEYKVIPQQITSYLQGDCAGWDQTYRIETYGCCDEPEDVEVIEEITKKGMA